MILLGGGPPNPSLWKLSFNCRYAVVMGIDCQNFSIATERLILKPVSMDWKNDIFREFTPEITVYMFPSPAKHISETENFIQISRKNMEEGIEIVLNVFLRETNEFLGCAGLHQINTKHPELGVWIKKSAHGNKYGREAMHALKKWADQHLHYEYIVYPVDCDNIASRKIPESLGGEVQSGRRDSRMGFTLLSCPSSETGRRLAKHYDDRGGTNAP